MAQTLTLDDLAAYGTGAPPPAAPPVAAPRQQTSAVAAPRAPTKPLSLGDLAAYGGGASETPAPAAAAKPDDPDQHGFFRSFYDEGIAPLKDLVVGTVKRGDLGAGAAEQILGGFYDQLKTFAGHPDIRNLPIIGTGATATAARMQRQYDKGNYAGMIGSAVGFLAPFAGPEAAKAAYDNLPAAGKAAAAATDAAGRWTEAAGAGLKAGAQAAAPDLAAGAAKAAAAAIAEHFIPGGGTLTKLAEYGGLARGGTQALRGLKAGVQAASEAYGDVRATQAADAATAAADAARAAAPARVPIWQQAYADAEAARAAEAARPPTEPLWVDARRAAAEKAAAPATLTLDDLEAFGKTETPAAPAAAEAAAAPEVDRDVIDERPDARTVVTPDETAQQPAPGHALADAIDRHAAYLHMQAQDLEWANRARQADQYAAWFIKNDLEPTPENLDRAAQELEPPDLDEGISKRTGLPLHAAEPPGPETTDMIRDRVDWHNARVAQAAPAETAAEFPIGQRPAAETGAAPATLEQQLQASIDAVKSRREQQAAQTGHVEGDVPVSGPGSGIEVESGRTRGGPAAAAPDTTGAGASGERTAVDIPGEQRTYPATYTVKELDDIQPSHNGETFQPNPDYGHANDRQYDDPRNQRKIVDWSTKQGFNPRNLLNTAPTAELGPPVVDEAGNVLGGNGRTMIMQRVYAGNPEGAAAYRAELDRTAHHYGIDPASYADMKQPVLVRELDPEIMNDKASAARAVTDFNKIGTAALTPAERAVADARGVSQRTLDDIAARMDRLGPDATLAQTLEGRQGVEVLGNLTRDGVISPQEGAELATETKLTRQGKERVSGLMLGRFFTDAKQMDALPDSLRNKLERMAAPLARAETAGYSLQPVIRSALDLLEDADAHGAATIDDYIRQQGLFSERSYSPEAIGFAKALKSGNPVELTHAARRYAERAKYAEEYQGPGMFGNIPAPLAPAAAFSDSFEHLAK